MYIFFLFIDLFLFGYEMLIIKGKKEYFLISVYLKLKHVGSPLTLPRRFF